MKVSELKYFKLMALVAMCLQGCIHEYPLPVGGVIPGMGEDPTAVNALVNVTFSMDWEDLMHSVEFDTKASESRNYRIVIEVKKGETTVCHDTEYVTSDRIRHGVYSHRLSVSLSSSLYNVAVWADCTNAEDKYSFDVASLDNVRLTNNSTSDSLAFDCSYSADLLDLRAFAGSEKTVNVTKEMTMEFPGAQYEIIASDIVQFIAENREALFDDDKFYVYLPFTAGAPEGMNLYTGRLLYGNDIWEPTGWMRLPFDSYEELPIARGFLFCSEEGGKATTSLRVTNKYLVTVSQTDEFSFPVKRGFVTRVRGDFLTHPIDGVFNVNSSWEGEIYFNYP